MINTKLGQTKSDAISAKKLHQRSKTIYVSIQNVITILTLIVPFTFISAQYIYKGTEHELFVNNLSFVLSFILIAIAIIGEVLQVKDKITLHKIGINDNVYIINECDNMVKATKKELEWFFRYVSKIDATDNDTFSKISPKLKRKTYREALKELIPGDTTVTCPICKSSPWKYKKGDCQLCGNTLNK